MAESKPRRPKGSGATFRLPDGRFAHQVTVSPLPGDEAQRPRITRYGKTAAEARRRVAEAVVERERKAREAPAITVADYLTRWLRDAVRPVRRPRTIEGYESAIRRYVLPPLGTVQLAALSPSDIQRVYATLQTAGLHATAHLVHTILHAAFRRAVLWELLDRNPADRVERPKRPTGRRQALTRGEVGRLMAALTDHPDEALYLVALTTGMREGELVGLRWASVDWSSGTVDVIEQMQRLGGTVQPGPPKSLSRLVPVPTFVLAALRRHQERQAFARQSAGAEWQAWGLVFPTALGTPQPRGRLLKQWRKLAASLDLPPLTLHALRRSYATLARAAGVQVETVQHTLGHTHVSMTLDVYRQVQDEDRAQAARQIEAYLAPPDEGPPGADSGGLAKP